MYQNIFKFIRMFFRKPALSPAEVQIEITNRCNYQCKICPRECIKNLPYQDMDMVLFEKILKKIPNTRELILVGWGEPLMHKEFIKCLMLIREILPKVNVRFTTNGKLLNKKFVTDILQVGNVSQISFSIDRVDKAEHDGHKNDKTVFDNIKYLCENKNNGLKVVFQTLLVHNGVEIVKKVIDKAQELKIDQMNIVRLDVRQNTIVRPVFKEEQKMLKKIYTYGRKVGFSVFSINKSSIIFRMATHNDKWCYRADNYLYIDVDGNVSPCCNLRAFRLGNIIQTNIEEIWNGKKIKNFRSNQENICKGCDALYCRHQH